MPKWLDTSGLHTVAIFVCDRCKMKRPLAEARSDINFPGLRVCAQGCADEKDPYRLPARQTERINLRFPRPDVCVATHPHDIVTDKGASIGIAAPYDPADGNIDTLSDR